MCCREQERKERQEKLQKSVRDLTQLAAKIEQEYAACKHPSLVSQAGTQALTLVRNLVARMGQIQTETQQSGDVRADQFEQSCSVLEKATNAYELIKQEIGMYLCHCYLLFFID